MLGAERSSAARYAVELFGRGGWTSPANEAHSGFAWSHFSALIERESPPPEIEGDIGRMLERLTWQSIHVARLLERAGEQLAT